MPDLNTLAHILISCRIGYIFNVIFQNKDTATHFTYKIYRYGSRVGLLHFDFEAFHNACRKGIEGKNITLHDYRVRSCARKLSKIAIKKFLTHKGIVHTKRRSFFVTYGPISKSDISSVMMDLSFGVGISFERDFLLYVGAQCKICSTLNMPNCRLADRCHCFSKYLLGK